MTAMDPQAHEQLAAINVKLDVLISRHGITEQRVTDHEARIRDVEVGRVRSEARLDDLAADRGDIESRLRILERARWPLPSLAALVSLAALILAAITFINKGG